jgi:hypothetical protein
LRPLSACTVLPRMGWELERLTDIKYQVFDQPEELCDSIQSGVKSGSLRNVLLNAHGNPSQIFPSAQKLISVLRSLPPNCFKGMPRDAKLFLSSCLGGFDLVPLNIAEWLAWESGIAVYASKDYVTDLGTSLTIRSEQEIEIDFCAYEEQVSYPLWNGGCSASYPCTQSMTRVFHPPVTLFEKSLFTAKMGVSALLGLFTAYELARIPLMTLSLASAIFSKTGALLPSVQKRMSPSH